MLYKLSEWYLPFMKAEKFNSHNLPSFPVLLFNFCLTLHFHLFFLLEKKRRVWEEADIKRAESNLVGESRDGDGIGVFRRRGCG